MKYTLLEKSLIEKLETAIVDVTPGVQVRAYHMGKVICDVSIGNTYAYYDLASLTKVIFTVQAMMLAFERKKWDLPTKVKSILSWFPYDDIKIYDLLTHTSGLAWWYPFFKEISHLQGFSEKKSELKKIIQDLPLKKEVKSIYSDVGFIVLAFCLEEFYQKDLLSIWEEIKNTFYIGTTLEFHQNNIPKHKVQFYAPTEECPWRKKLIQGEVHDENCWAMGGVSTHAGLFGSIDDVSCYLLTLRSQLQGIARYQLRQKTAQLFAKRAIHEEQGDWALGFMMPTPGTASCGGYFSAESIGHTGFTGTSIWYDPTVDIGITVLSNRVLYGRDKTGFRELRPMIHNWVIEGFRKSGV